MKKEGFSLIELVVVVALVGILLFVASLSSKKIIEDRALEEAKSGVVETMRSYIERSYNEGQEYTIEVENEVLTVLKGDKSSVDEVERIKLPEMLRYEIEVEGVSSASGIKITTLGTEAADDEKMTVEVYIKEEGTPRYTIKMGKKGVTELMDVSIELE